nr:hypothetical protein [Tanacetum cinerariifolium]
IDGVGWDWSYMENEGEDHALVADGEAPDRYNAVPPPAADLYLSPKKDLSWTGLPEFMDDTVTDYSRTSSTVASTSAEGQNKDSSTFEDVASPNPPKPFVKRRVQRETTRSQNHTYKSPSHRSGGHRPHGAPMRPPLRSSGHRPHRGSMRPSHRPAGHRPHEEIFPLPIRNFPLLAENLPLVAQKITLLIWEGKEKLVVPRTTLMTKVIGTVAALGT